jgi:hypothetical protein
VEQWKAMKSLDELQRASIVLLCDHWHENLLRMHRPPTMDDSAEKSGAAGVVEIIAFHFNVFEPIFNVFHM